ncbi:uncharacterized protein LOC130131387 [Lampris incognitus]|uniref:uncharacterized protein LOC130131387 n=1 Tax=Lampris incognitus TaxID=2546036 RepID=UPI0024B52FC6|nr:uncharacterized protein LOC130131387 [Lampris incognitus]
MRDAASIMLNWDTSSQLPSKERRHTRARGTEQDVSLSKGIPGLTPTLWTLNLSPPPLSDDMDGRLFEETVPVSLAPLKIPEKDIVLPSHSSAPSPVRNTDQEADFPDLSGVPSCYWALKEVFNKSKAKSLRPHRPYDCAIDLLPGTTPPKERLYSVSGPETQAIRNYIDLALEAWIVLPSSSSAGAGFLFVGRQDPALTTRVSTTSQLTGFIVSEGEVKMFRAVPEWPTPGSRKEAETAFRRLKTAFTTTSFSLSLIRDSSQWWRLTLQIWESEPSSLSYHNNQKEDRRWSLSCKSLPNTQKCYWSNFVNGFDKNVDFSCRQNYVVAGVYSYHSNSHEDRRWRFYCCTAPQFETSDCQETTWMNYWDEYFNWYVPGANYLTGLKSYHRNDKEDRRWRYTYCRGERRDTRSSTNFDVMSKILNANKVLSRGYTEGDIAVPRTRNARICNTCRWPKSSKVVEIPYTISSSFSSSHKSIIGRAMKTFSSSTCIRFIPRCSQTNYISIVSKNGCSSHVGRTGGSQELSLSTRGCVYHGIIQHELIHALGFWHEQSRSDRDRYVRINWENIQNGRKHNFNRYTTNNLNTQYDYSSVMHYGKTAFSKNGKDTITPLRSNVRIGQRDGMSKIDILKINKLYNCSMYIGSQTKH